MTRFGERNAILNSLSVNRHSDHCYSCQLFCFPVSGHVLDCNRACPLGNCTHLSLLVESKSRMFFVRRFRIGSAHRCYNDGVGFLRPNIQQRSSWLPCRWRMGFRCGVCNLRGNFWYNLRCCFDDAILDSCRSHWTTRFKLNQTEWRIKISCTPSPRWCFTNLKYLNCGG
jgi:hypothetical protein